MNPVQMMMQMLTSGGSPMQIMQQLAGSNPALAPALKLCQGKNPDQLKQTFYNLCKSKGIDPNQVASQCGVTLPQ